MNLFCCTSYIVTAFFLFYFGHLCILWRKHWLEMTSWGRLRHHPAVWLGLKSALLGLFYLSWQCVKFVCSCSQQQVSQNADVPVSCTGAEGLSWQPWCVWLCCVLGVLQRQPCTFGSAKCGCVSSATLSEKWGKAGWPETRKGANSLHCKICKCVKAVWNQ